MSSKTYSYKKGLRQSFSAKMNSAKAKLATVLTALIVLAGAATPIAMTHAQGGSGGGGTNSGGGGSTTTTTTSSSTTNVPKTSGGGGSAKTPTPCDTFSALTATADDTAITASYAIAACVSGKTTVTLRIRNTVTNTVEYTAIDPNLNTVVYANPTFATAYEVEVSAFSSRSLSVIGTKTVAVTTPILPENCATIATNDPHVGYIGTYAAIWLNYTAINCGYGRTSAEIIVTDLSDNSIDADYKNYAIVGLIDFEGAYVKYDNNYQVDVYIHGAMGEVLDHTTAVVTTPSAL